MNKNVKKLFIINNVGMIGGANNSLRQTIENIDEKVDLIAPVDASVSNQKLKKFFGDNINQIFRFYLPCRSSIQGYDNSLADKYLIETRYKENKDEIFDLIEKNRYESVHLNSYVLYPMLDKKYPMFLHVREVYEGSCITRGFVLHKMNQAKGIIFIDWATKKGWMTNKRKTLVLNNPFNQRAVLDVNVEETRQKYDVQTETIFLFVTAQIIPVKGLDFVIDAFLKANCKNAKLFIAGSTELTKYKGCNNIRFLGQVQHMDELYAISDYVIRGEPFFAIGRTVYEGLYSGCNAIIPGDEIVDSNKIFDRKRFKDYIIFYKPRDTEALSSVIRAKENVKKKAVLGLSNERQYIKKYQMFIQSCLKGQRSGR